MIAPAARPKSPTDDVGRELLPLLWPLRLSKSSRALAANSSGVGTFRPSERRKAANNMMNNTKQRLMMIIIAVIAYTNNTSTTTITMSDSKHHSRRHNTTYDFIGIAQLEEQELTT